MPDMPNTLRVAGTIVRSAGPENIDAIFPIAGKNERLSFISNGGHGGRGGNGGDGSKGLNSNAKNVKGGKGGNGGNATSGGRGGAGGNIEITVAA